MTVPKMDKAHRADQYSAGFLLRLYQPPDRSDFELMPEYRGSSKSPPSFTGKEKATSHVIVRHTNLTLL
jgi:hypothetical protein